MGTQAALGNDEKIGKNGRKGFPARDFKGFEKRLFRKQARTHEARACAQIGVGRALRDMGRLAGQGLEKTLRRNNRRAAGQRPNPVPKTSGNPGQPCHQRLPP